MVALSTPDVSMPSSCWARRTCSPELPSQANGRLELRGEATAAGHAEVRGLGVATTAGWPEKYVQVPKSGRGTDPVQNEVVPRAPFHDSEMWMCEVCGSPPV